MQRPRVGDRWQNRRTSRVCVIEAAITEPAAATSIAYRYEGGRNVQYMTLGRFGLAFTAYETKGDR